MSNTITLSVLNRQIKLLNDLQKAGIDFEITTCNNSYNVDFQPGVHPKIKNGKTVVDLSAYFQAKMAPFKMQTINEFQQLNQILEQGSNARSVSTVLTKQPNSPVKFYAEETFDAIEDVSMYLISAAPRERTVGAHTYRTLIAGDSHYHGTVVLCLQETHAAYNYIDVNNIVVFTETSNSSEPCILVTNQLSLDMNYIIAAFALYPPALKDVMENGIFVNYRDARVNLLRVERAMPPRFQAEYKARKAKVLAEFEKNAQHVMISKLTRNEAPFIELNRIKVTTTKATYETVSIEADDLADVVFRKLNPLEEWDIFTLINIYTDHIESYFNSLPTNITGTGFAAAAEKTFKINGAEIRVAVCTSNTRRSINGRLINAGELSQVMRRAACFVEADPEANNRDFQNFVRDVAKRSLYVTDVLNQGLPVKTAYLESDNQYGKDATVKHPKLKFTKEGLKYFLCIDQDTKREVKQFVQLLRKIEANNRKHTRPHYGYGRTHEGGYETGQAPNDCALALLPVLKSHIAELAAADLAKIVNWVNKERIQAHERSEELLKYAVKITKAERKERAGKWGYSVQGQLRTYFVEEDALRVYEDNKSNNGAYFCVVNGRNTTGVGRDGLVTRLFALSNDSMVTKDVGTLALRA